MIPEQDWERIAARLPDALSRSVANLQVVPHWLDAGRFWYRRDGDTGIEHVIVDVGSGHKRRVFDTPPPGLDMAKVEIVAEDERGVTLALGHRVWFWDGMDLQPRSDRPNADDESLSPDGRHVLFRREGDLWLRSVAEGTERRLTDSAEPHFEWAKSPDQSLETIHLLRQGLRLPPIVLWSPDSRRIFTYQLDERRVRRVPIVQNVAEDGGFAPVLYELRNAFVGDAELPMAHQAIIEIDTGRIVPHAGGPVHVTETSGLEKREAWWSADGTRVFFLDHGRFERKITLVEIDAETGAERRVLSERAETFADVNLAYGALPNIRVLDRTDEVLWFSQRDGWAHLYLHDLRTGQTRARVTAGEWPVCDLLHVDEARRQVIILAGSPEASADPYRRRVCVAPLDGGPMRVLTPGEGDHTAFLASLGWPDLLDEAATVGVRPAAVAPDGGHVVVTSAGYGDLGTTRLIRVADGAPVAELERGSAGIDLIEPERMDFLAADGETRIFGMIWRPAGFAPSQSWPVLDMVYPGPQCIQAPRSALPADDLRKIGLAQAVAALGIAVVMIDGRGTPYRSKAFHDLCHGNLADPGFLTDHVAALKQLADRFPWIDPGRIGIMGHSAGGHAAARGILAHPDTYSVAVSTAGCHELRSYNHCWPEKWQGELVRHADGTTSYDAAANAPLADRLLGRLLLGHGDMDENVLPLHTLQLAGALAAAGKDFDLLMVPNTDHATFKRNPYVQRRLLEYLARHLAA